MSYRKIEVNGIACEYVVGKSHVKIKIPGKGSHAFPIAEVGTCKEHVDLNECTNEIEVCGFTDYSVTPYDIARKIKGLL